MTQDASIYRFYSTGTVTKDLVRGSNEIQVNLTEKSSLSNGDLNKQTAGDVSMPDSRGVARKASGASGRTVPAKWIPLGTPNQATPPDVVNGETVMVWKVGDVEEYFWTTMMFEPELRRKEHVVYVYCNIPNGRAPLTEDTSYWAKWSTQDKLVHFHTSKNDGEVAAYDIMIDSGNGQIVIQDDMNNSFILDTPSNTIQLATVKDFNVETGSAVNITTKNAVVNAETTTVNCPDNTFNGDVNINGALKVSGGISMGAPSGRSARAARAAAEMLIYGNIRQLSGGFDSSGDIKSSTSVTAPVGNFGNL